MGLLGSLSRRGGFLLAPRIGTIAPGFTAGFLQKVLDVAVAGIGPFASAAEVADHALAEAGGDVDRAVAVVVRSHTRLSGAQGFVTNIGGLITLAVSIPANVVGLVLVQLRLHAAIARLHGHDLTDPGVRAAVLVTLLGHDETERLVRSRDLPGNALARRRRGHRSADDAAGVRAGRGDAGGVPRGQAAGDRGRQADPAVRWRRGGGHRRPGDQTPRSRRRA
ncbi:hypothetical protein [Nocardioides rubriscoriae]|uniref:hypothetical protein n=1 Tax=Nocardioides rubriscoriae TaxID=642762 RepID=UPI0011DFE8FF|nr:hypothetical protein [Nocardioides rubriscoriae]